MKEIWKFQLDGTHELDMPEEAKILTVGNQHHHITLWAEVDPGAVPETRRFRVYGTGHPFEASESLVYLGTVQEPPFVWHVFEQR